MALLLHKTLLFLEIVGSSNDFFFFLMYVKIGEGYLWHPVLRWVVQSAASYAMINFFFFLCL